MAIFPQDRRASVERTLTIPARMDDELKEFAEARADKGSIVLR